MLKLSSGAVYGKQPPELEQILENFPCNPISEYGKGKLIAENLCLNSGVDCVIARCFVFVGPGMPLNAHLAIGILDIALEVRHVLSTKNLLMSKTQ